MKIVSILIAAIVLASIIVAPAVAEDATAPAQEVKYGLVDISIRQADPTTVDNWERYISIAPYGEGKPVIHPDLGANARRTISLPAGNYYIVLPKGQGSGFMMDTWKPEAYDITVTGTGTIYVNFIGAGI